MIQALELKLQEQELQKLPRVDQLLSLGSSINYSRNTNLPDHMNSAPIEPRLSKPTLN